MSVCTIVNKYSSEHGHYCPIKASRFDELGTYMRALNAVKPKQSVHALFLFI